MTKNDTETKLYNWLRRRASDAQFQRIETSTSQGVPDLYACRGGESVWIELKITRGKHTLLRPTQYAWGVRHSKHGGKAVVLSRKGDTCFLWRFPYFKTEPRGKVLTITSVPSSTFDVGSDADVMDWILHGLT